MSPTSSSRRRVLVSIGTRPEAIKLAPVVRALAARPEFEVLTVATAQHRELLDQILAFFELRPDLDLDLMRAGQGLAELTARMTAALDRVLSDTSPDLVLAQGDTTTVFVTALCCFYRGIPFGHVEAGLRTGRRRSPFPEEMNRVLTGRLADLHFAPTARAAANLLAEGLPEAAVLVTGNTVIDALRWTVPRVDASPFTAHDGRRSLLVTTHRRESFGPPLLSICHALADLAARGDVEILYPVHPNPKVRETVRHHLGDHPRVRLVEPLGYPEFVAAMTAAHLVLTDSGGVQEEAPSLGKPVLVLRDDTERPEGIEAGTARLVGTDRAGIVAAATALLDDDDAYAAMARRANPYGDGHAAERIAERVATHLACRPAP
ncbi:MAG: UDP-N-acetylglucosamine 2-epimerase (non-hydrolyzing) [Planctomycetes bacterium]|nr:UDP-N-acetylglucosamine 2-epimerase (non-hydrolyzing) [Planctomycetota bacterium]